MILSPQLSGLIPFIKAARNYHTKLVAVYRPPKIGRTQHQKVATVTDASRPASKEPVT